MRHAWDRVPLRLVGYVLMPNHWHLLVWPDSATQVSQYLHLVTGAHAARWRWRAGRVGEGHVYQDRYHAFVVESERQYFNVLRYVEANPVRAGLVTTATDWLWSSLAERQSGIPDLITPGPFPLPAGWVELVDQAVPPDVLFAFRENTRRTQHP
jgi:putative transposase